MSYLSPLSPELAEVLPARPQAPAHPAIMPQHAANNVSTSRRTAAAGWMPNELGLAWATLLASAFALAFSTLFVNLHGVTWLQAAWLSPDAVSWSGPEITTESLLGQPAKMLTKTAMLMQR